MMDDDAGAVRSLLRLHRLGVHVRVAGRRRVVSIHAIHRRLRLQSHVQHTCTIVGDDVHGICHEHTNA